MTILITEPYSHRIGLCVLIVRHYKYTSGVSDSLKKKLRIKSKLSEIEK